MWHLVFRGLEDIACTPINALVAHKACWPYHGWIFQWARLALDWECEFTRVVENFSAKITPLLPSYYEWCLKWILLKFVVLRRLGKSCRWRTTEATTCHHGLSTLCMLSTRYFLQGLLCVRLLWCLAHEKVQEHCVYLDQVPEFIKLKKWLLYLLRAFL